LLHTSRSFSLKWNVKQQQTWKAKKLTRMDNKTNFSREVKLQWLDLEKEISPPVVAELLLDIPFYRTF